jgi:hypothetical protein
MFLLAYSIHFIYSSSRQFHFCIGPSTKPSTLVRMTGRIILLFDTHHVQICHYEEQRDTQRVRSPFHCLLAKMMLVLQARGCSIKLVVFASKREGQTEVDEQHEEFQGMSRHMTSEVNMRLCLSLGNFGNFARRPLCFLLSGLIDSSSGDGHPGIICCRWNHGPMTPPPIPELGYASRNYS